MEKYKRLTERDKNGFIEFEECKKCDYCGSAGCNSFENAKTRLAELEDDLESGKMIRLPCKVGDRIWVILGNNIFGRKVKSILIHESYTIKTSDTSGWKELEPYYEKEFGIIWFTNKAEAEKKLKS